MYEQVREDTIFIMLYAVVTAMAVIASCYLLFRRANAIAPDITPPLRLRRWTAGLFAVFALNHVWYMPLFFLSSSEDVRMCDLVGGLLDCMTLFPVAIIVLLAMLQDRRRPLWPVWAMMAPVVALGTFSVAISSYALQPLAYIYALVMCIGLIIYMVRALRQYGHWLRDNFADLEHKEVWQSFVVLAIILLVFVVYVFVSEGPAYQYAMQVILFILIYYLLWRVETLSDLSISQPKVLPIPLSIRNRPPSPLGLSKNIGPLLKQHCEESRLYLQYDITLSLLAREIGVNRLYLSQYFSGLGMNYNAYINDLRVNHFMGLYREAVAAHRPVIAQQLALESGYRSYSTFSDAFKRKTGQSVTAWMKAASEQEQSQACLGSAAREQARPEGKSASEQEQSQAPLEGKAENGGLGKS